MEELVKVAVDAMGGDNAPAEIIQGVADALEASTEVKVMLVGREEIIREELSKIKCPEDRLEIVPAAEVISTAEAPVAAIRSKKDSSMVKAMDLVSKGEADAVVSAGSSGAVLVGGQLIIGKQRGIKRAPLAPLIPTENGAAILIDCGANVDARADHLVQFARMGSIYMEHVMNIDHPKVALVNIGAEEEKGNALVKETMPLLKECEDINFIGSIEARDIPSGYADVIVCDAFVGNVILKMYEGVSNTLMSVLKQTIKSSIKTMIGGMLINKSLKNALKRFDSTQYGGAPLLGLKGLVVKCHGSSTRKEIRTAILQCVTFTKQDINGMIGTQLRAARGTVE